MDESKKKPPLIAVPDGDTAPSVSYTSLRDLIPAESPPSIMSPTHNASWHEIPIKNPLVKQAARSYLQPMSAPPEAGDKGIFGNLRDMLCSSESCGCFAWLSDAVSKRVSWVLGGGDHDGVREWIAEDDGFDDDDEDGDKERVD